jgi:hypothetical protein
MATKKNVHALNYWEVLCIQVALADLKEKWTKDKSGAVVPCAIVNIAELHMLISLSNKIEVIKE